MLANFGTQYIKCIYLNELSTFKLTFNLTAYDIKTYYRKELDSIQNYEDLDSFVGMIIKKGLMTKLKNNEIYNENVREDNTYCIFFKLKCDISLESEAKINEIRKTLGETNE